MRTTFLLALALFHFAGRLAAAERVDYLRDIKPLLSARCYACHGALQQKSGLRLDTVRSILKGGDGGPVIIPGHASESTLISRISSPSRRMPPAGLGEQLAEKQIALLRAWVDQGATGPPDEKPEPDPRDHWAFRTPVRPALPGIKDSSRVRNVVDVFLAAAREKHGLTPQPVADRRLLLRRLYVDLIGVPPTRAEQLAFLADASPNAYEKVVDRLLASPQYAERWARHWMDIWRYSDWWGLGAEVRNSQKHIWHWRGWIRESLDADVGYDEMLREMLAADELYPTDPNRLRATGYLARSYFIFNRTTWLDEVLEHTGKAFLGLTLNCAKCHDHKYDPISQMDYYRLRAFFEPYQVRTDQVPGESDFARDGLPRVFDCNLDAPTYRFIRGDDRRPDKDRPVKPGLPPLLASGKLDIQAIALPPEAHSPQLHPFVLDNYLKAAQRQIDAARTARAAAENALSEARNRPVEPGGTATTPTAFASPVTGDPLVVDDFARPSPELWTVGPGKWKHEGGKLKQLIGGAERSWLRLRRTPPADFEARFRFRITGGDPWRSVGIGFDRSDANETLPYVSGATSGPKVQIAVKQNSGDYTYPEGAMRAWPVPLNEPIEFTVRVRGPLINVAVNGTFAVAYRQPRHAGNLELITFAATADFDRFELRALPAATVLADPTPAGTPERLTVAQAEAALVVAEKTLAVAQLQPAVLRARAAADRARLVIPPAATAGELAREAARAENLAAVAAAEEEVARATLEVLKANPAAKSAADAKRKSAQDRLDQARTTLANPGQDYTQLRGSLKTPESNLETETSRNKPFPTTSTGRRSTLARWITDPRHPLTARVAVNHLWMRHFGKSLVPTVFDFGRRAPVPDHRELLDYLAVDFMEHGWSLKHLHRLLVTSDAYRMTSSSAGASSAGADSENRWYWRMNPVRMEAQVVRDSLLQLAGELDQTIGGPPIDPIGQEASRRRSMYFVHSHNDHHHFLSMFDDASVLECYRRTESIVPQQALALSNSGFSLTEAAKITARLHEELGSVSEAEFVRAAFELILASSPTPGEQAECEQALRDLTELLRRAGAADAERKARADLVGALLNHNDFITVR
jgi:hypothetical protein